MPSRIIADSWETTLPEGWDSEVDDVCWTLFDPDGVGVLQISGATKESDISNEDLREFAADHIRAGAKIREFRCGDYIGLTLAYRDEDTHWQEWYLRCARHMLFITYNCPSADRGDEEERLRKILDGLHHRNAETGLPGVKPSQEPE